MEVGDKKTSNSQKIDYAIISKVKAYLEPKCVVSYFSEL